MKRKKPKVIVSVKKEDNTNHEASDGSQKDEDVSKMPPVPIITHLDSKDPSLTAPTKSPKNAVNSESNASQSQAVSETDEEDAKAEGMDQLMPLSSPSKIGKGKSPGVDDLEAMIKKSFTKKRITQAGGVLVEELQTESSDEDFELESAKSLTMTPLDTPHHRHIAIENP